MSPLNPNILQHGNTFASFMAEEQQERSSHFILSGQPSSAAPTPTDLGDILEAQKQAILSAVNSQIQNLQTNLLTAQAELSSRIAAESQADTYAFKKKGNERQFQFNRTVIKKNHAALHALEGSNVAQAKEELAAGMSLLHNRQKLIKLADKSEFGWTTVQEYIDDELADDEADASKIQKAEKRAGARVKSLQEKKRKTVQPKPVTAVSNSVTPTRHSVAHGSLPPNFAYFRPQGRYSSHYAHSFKALDLCFRCGKQGHWASSCSVKNKSNT